MTLSEASNRAVEARTQQAADELTLAQSDSVQARLARHGISETVIFNKIKSLLSATDTRFFAEHGVVTDSRTVPHHDIRLRTTVTVLKMLGLLSDRNTVVNVGNAMVAFAESGPPAWTPAPVRQQLADSASKPAVNNDSDTSTVPSSTLVGPLRRTGGLGHDHRNNRWRMKCSPDSKLAKRCKKRQAHGKTRGGNKGGLHRPVPAKRKRKRK